MSTDKPVTHHTLPKVNIVFQVTQINNMRGSRISTVDKSIPLIDQLMLAIKSIRLNWKSFDYSMYVFHNKSHSFCEEVVDKLEQLSVNLVPCEPDHPKQPHLCRCAALTTNIDNGATHRLILDSDIVALKEPEFNFASDWQAMFTHCPLSYKEADNINSMYNFNLDLSRYNQSMNFERYVQYGFKHDLFPHFNAGCILIRETLCNKYVGLYKEAYNIAFDKRFSNLGRHIGIQYACSFALIKLSSQWTPLPLGTNHLIKLHNKSGLKKSDVCLLHYAGTGGWELAIREFPEIKTLTLIT